MPGPPDQAGIVARNRREGKERCRQFSETSSRDPTRSTVTRPNPQHHRHLPSDSPHGRRIETADSLTHIGQSDRLRPIHHHLRRRPQTSLLTSLNIDPHADASTQIRGDGQYRRIGKFNEQIGTDHDSGTGLVPRQPDQHYGAPPNGAGGYRHSSVRSARCAKSAASEPSSFVS
ncbi:MAG: hypothetical protein QOD93_4375 [Acetobacteraceae bacterium]|jgi:hypothetical protein|nr:hypothetical protein [Rhodopila sp.]MEA2726967.1 hypothetical protein [Acetobacteraceae bacterium]MEA2771413.1 hypothetical protein [Acetobacteraceae bacterium]